MAKKKMLVIIAVIVFVAAACSLMFTNIFGSKPFKDLDDTDIQSATVQLMPPGKTVEITEIKELVEYLKQVVVYAEDSSYTEYSGQSVVYHIIFTDGTEMSINAYNPFIIIDGVGYRCKYGPCEKLNNLANRLLDASESDSTKSSEESWGITLTAENITPTGVTILCTQSGI